MDSASLVALNARPGEDYLAYQLTRQVEYVAYSLSHGVPGCIGRT